MKEKRIKESDLVKPALRIIKDKPGINTSDLIIELQKVVQVYPGDREIINNRKDTRFSQTVRNLVSHSKTNKFGKCTQRSSQQKNADFYINELGEKEIEGYQNKEIRDEIEDNKLQRKIRESKAYSFKDLKEADIRKPEKTNKSNNSKYKVDSRISKTVLKQNDYICEIEKLTRKKHKTFATDKELQYMEGHHLIPMKAQRDFDKNIDRSDNICCLCPNCHRAIHYGTIKEKKSRLELLYCEKIKNLKEQGIYIDLEELINKYYI